MLRQARIAITILPLTVLAACAGEEGAVEDRPVDMSNPVGLYEASLPEGGGGRACVTGDEAEGFRFALVTRGSEGAACGGAGEVSLSDGTMRFVMAGDEECEVAAQVEGADVVFAPDVPESCAYYCSPDASLAAKRFTKTGDTLEDARKARDLVGDPLCR